MKYRGRISREGLSYPSVWHCDGASTVATAFRKRLLRFTRNDDPSLFVCNQRGMALVITLMVLVIITAMVVEFSYGVYTGTNSLYNWRDSQRLSIMAKSGINVSARFLSDKLSSSYSYPLELPVENPFEDFKGVITVRIEDESSKFNLNSIVYKNGNPNMDAYEAFRRLLRILSLDERIADRIADWIDSDSDPRLPDSEVGAKNAALDTVDELLLINGISRKDYDTLLPYITADKNRDNLVININAAPAPVLMSMSASIDDTVAQRIIKYRELNPFDGLGQVYTVARFETGTGISLVFKGTSFRIKSSAESGGVKRIIEAVLNTASFPATVAYWKEY